MTARQPFFPHYGQNLVVAPAAASASSAINADDKQARVCNSGANIGYFRTYNSFGGTVAQNATVADCPVLPGGTLIVSTGPQHDAIAYISAAGTTFQIQTGEGGV
ncbi:MAG: hypothetical protein V4641_31295 [Pseudomonadota bacterium]